MPQRLLFLPPAGEGAEGGRGDERRRHRRDRGHPPERRDHRRMPVRPAPPKASLKSASSTTPPPTAPLRSASAKAIADPACASSPTPTTRFAVACNHQGAADLPAQWLAFVNPGLLRRGGSLARLRGHAESLARRCRRRSGRRGRNADAAARRAIPISLFAMLRDPSRATRRRPIPAQALQSVDAVSGALMLLRRACCSNASTVSTKATGCTPKTRPSGACAETGVVVRANDRRRVVVHVQAACRRVAPGVRRVGNKHRGLWRYYRET